MSLPRTLGVFNHHNVTRVLFALVRVGGQGDRVLSVPQCVAGLIQQRNALPQDAGDTPPETLS